MTLRSRIRYSFAETFQTLFSTLTMFIWAASVVLATIAGPFDTYSAMAWPLRAVYWCAIVSTGVVIGYGVRALAFALVGTARPLLMDAVMVALMTTVFSPIVWLITRTALNASAGELPSLAMFGGYVAATMVVVVVVRRIAPGFEAQGYPFLTGAEPEVAADGGNLETPRLLRRLTSDVEGKVLRLTANDHFVEVATEKGAESLRMRLADAIDEMEPVNGYCVHRSHWVAHDAIVRVERENSHKLFVVLSNNDRIPVSRKYRINVEKAGWI